MSSFYITTKNDTKTTVGPVTLNSETPLITIASAPADYIMEGYVDISALVSGDTLVVTEYMAIDGTNYRIFKQTTYFGPVTEDAIRFHAKTLNPAESYKVTVKQTSGTGRSFPIVFVQEIFNA